MERVTIPTTELEDSREIRHRVLRRPLSRRWLRLGAAFVGAFIAATFLSILVYWFAWLAGIGGPDDEPPAADFAAYWAASSLVLDGEADAVYDAAAIRARQEEVARVDDVGLPWLYPPYSLFFVLPLGLAPLGVSLAAWVVVTGGVFLASVRRICRSRVAIVLAAVFPATLWNVFIGQNGLLTAGLFAWGMLALNSRPVASGLTLGLLAFKPQLFPLILVALLAGRKRLAFAAAVASFGALLLASVAFFGLGAWEEFASSVPRTSDLVYEGRFPLAKMQSVTAAVLLAGATPAVSQVAQAAAGLISVGFVVWLWRRKVSFEYQAAGLALAALFAAPYSYHYDLTIMGLAMLWLGVRARQDGWKRWEREVLVLAWFTPLVSLVIGQALHFVIGPFVILLLMGLLLRRVLSEEVLSEGPARAESGRTSRELNGVLP